MSNFFNRLQETMARRGSRPCLLADEGTVSHAALDERSARFAAVLRRCGADPGDTVLVTCARHVDTIALYLASLRAGLVWVPANPACTAAELAFAAGDARPRIVVCDPDRPDHEEAARSAAAGAARLTLGAGGAGTLAGQAAACAPALDVAPRHDRDPAAMLYTSGTTGRPKGVPLSHGNLASNAQALVEAWAFGADDVLIHALPLFHVHGLFVALHCALLAGASVRLLPRFEAATVRAAMRGASVMMGVPTFYRRLLGLEEFGAADCASMRLFVSGSAPLTERLFHEFEARTGHRILERYGMTETNMIATNPLAGPRVAGTVGYPLPGVEVRVRDPDGSRAATDAVGILEVRGPNVFAGYHARPEADAEAFTADGWFRTGDLARIAGDGRITLTGRARDLVISGGFNVYPVEIERCLDECPGVAESAVVGVPHEDLGEAVIAVVVPSDPASPPDTRALQAALEARLARYKHPRRIVLCEALPRNAMGKVQKQQLRETHAGRFRQAP
jgi:malonyl-CoA/methylmalonyl-CoA synthetase